MTRLDAIDVFDGFKLDGGRPDIFRVNSFLYFNTSYKYFLFNDRIYLVSNPSLFSITVNDTGFIKKDLV